MKGMINKVVAIIDYKAGNAPSVLHAVSHLGHEAILAQSAKEISGATHIMLPGVGSARATMDSLEQLGLLGTLEDAVLKKKTPFLGICVGLQVLFEHSEEGNAGCLGWLKGSVFRYDSSSVRVPQMGWNKVTFTKATAARAQDDYFYFVNSYFVKPGCEADIWGTADYGSVFTAAVNRDNIYGMQFHVEKSGEAGLSLLSSFLGVKGGKN